jgi:hypothetical protein
MGEETPSCLRRVGHSSSSATDAHEARKTKGLQWTVTSDTLTLASLILPAGSLSNHWV